MKKITIITGLACLATISSVFGAWVFGEKTFEYENVFKTSEISVDVNFHDFGGAEVDVNFGFDTMIVEQYYDDNYRMVPYGCDDGNYMTIDYECNCNDPEGWQHRHIVYIEVSSKKEVGLNQYFNISQEPRQAVSIGWSNQAELDEQDWILNFRDQPLVSQLWFDDGSRVVVDTKEKAQQLIDTIKGDTIVVDVYIRLDQLPTQND